MVLRGESRYMAQLPDIIAVKLSNEDFILCQTLILIMRNGKLNRYYKIKYIKAIRNREIFFDFFFESGFLFLLAMGISEIEC